MRKSLYDKQFKKMDIDRGTILLSDYNIKYVVLGLKRKDFVNYGVVLMPLDKFETAITAYCIITYELVSELKHFTVLPETIEKDRVNVYLVKLKLQKNEFCSNMLDGLMTKEDFLVNKTKRVNYDVEVIGSGIDGFYIIYAFMIMLLVLLMLTAVCYAYLGKAGLIFSVVFSVICLVVAFGFFIGTSIEVRGVAGK